MHILTSPPPLQRSSCSLPLLPRTPTPIAPLHKIRKTPLQTTPPSPFLPFISLQATREGDDLDSKIKGIQRRNVKKLEERYDTIDRWKEKYIPESSVLIIRQKMSSEKLLSGLESSRDLHRSSPAVARRG